MGGEMIKFGKIFLGEGVQLGKIILQEGVDGVGEEKSCPTILKNAYSVIEYFTIDKQLSVF